MLHEKSSHRLRPLDEGVHVPQLALNQWRPLRRRSRPCEHALQKSAYVIEAQASTTSEVDDGDVVDDGSGITPLASDAPRDGEDADRFPIAQRRGGMSAAASDLADGKAFPVGGGYGAGS